MQHKNLRDEICITCPSDCVKCGAEIWDQTQSCCRHGAHIEEMLAEAEKRGAEKERKRALSLVGAVHMHIGFRDLFTYSKMVEILKAYEEGSNA